MAEASHITGGADEGMAEYIRGLRSLDKFAGVSAAVQSGSLYSVGGLFGSSPALFLAALEPDVAGSILVTVAGVKDARRFFEDLLFFFKPERLALFPAWESGAEDQETFSRRLEVLCRLLSPEPPKILVAPALSVAQDVVPAEAVAKNTRSIRVGQELDLKAFSAWLESRDLRRVPMAESGGEWSLRGSILDVYPHSSGSPFRIEFVGDSIESIREYDPATQASVRKLKECRVTLVQRKRFLKPGAEERPASILDYLPEKSACAFLEKDKIDARIAEIFQRTGDARAVVGYEKFGPAASKFARLFLSSLPRDPAAPGVDFVVRSVHRTAPGIEGAIGGFRELIKKKL